jgi:hypothetical protein
MNDCGGHLLGLVILGRFNDDPVTHGGRIARLRVTFVLEPYLFIEEDRYNWSSGRFDLNVFGIDGRHNAEHMKICAGSHGGGCQ